MNRSTSFETGLIPQPVLIRVELARSVREARRLRSLLRLAMQADEDHRFLLSLVPKDQAVAPDHGGGH